MPLLLFPALYHVADTNFQQKLSRILIFLFFLNFIFQLYQLGGYFLLGNTRNPGLFAMPSTTALFSLMVMYYVYHFYTNNLLRNILVYFFGPLSVLLTASGAGVIGLVFFFLIAGYFKIHNKWLFGLICIPVLILLFFSVLPKMPFRKNVYASPVKRLGLFKDSLQQKDLLLSTNFGSGTRTANLLKRTYDRGPSKVYTDSTITVMLTSFGLIPLIFLLLFIVKPLQCNILHLHFICIFGLFALTTIIFEAFPANLLFMINLSYFYNQQQTSILKNTVVH